MPVSNRKSDEWYKTDITGLLGVARDEGRFDKIRSMNAAGWQARSVGSNRWHLQPRAQARSPDLRRSAARDHETRSSQHSIAPRPSGRAAAPGPHKSAVSGPRPVAESVRRASALRGEC